MEFKVKRVKGYNCPNKSLLLIDSEPVIFANGDSRIKDIISYIGGDSSVDVGSCVKTLKHYREQYKAI